MTDEEKAHNYYFSLREKNIKFNYENTRMCIIQAYLDGLTEGRKEQKNKDNGFCELVCMKGGKTAELEKQNAELRKRIVEYNACGNTVDKQTYNEVANELTVLKAEIGKIGS